MKTSQVQKSKRAAGLVCLLSLIVAPWSAHADDSAYRILITNDDGIEADGLAALVEELQKSATVLVCAPATQQSGRSMATSMNFEKGKEPGIFVLTEPLKVTGFKKDGKDFGLSVEGTPADAVTFGIKYFKSQESPIDLVVSGINHGANLGAARGSGTVGAAFKALELGVPAIAVSSQFNKDYSVAARYAAKIVAQVREKGALTDSVISINVPAGEIQGVIATPASVSKSSPYVITSDIVPVETEDQKSFLLHVKAHWATDGVATENSNTYYFARKNYITVTPLKHDPTDYEALSALNLWDLEQ